LDIDRLFGEAARARVAEAIRRAESFSRGQIVPVVVEKSDPYPETRARGGLALGALATAGWLALHPEGGVVELVVVQLVAGLAGALLAAWDPVERVLAGTRSMDEAVRARALRAFHEHALHRTGEGTGVLLFASLFERQAVVLGDHGIHAKVGDAGWDRAVNALVKELRAGDPAAGFLDAIALCGAQLAEHFPRDGAAPPPPNELEDAIRAEKR
jgi:putative membrane protein